MFGNLILDFLNGGASTDPRRAVLGAQLGVGAGGRTPAAGAGGAGAAAPATPAQPRAYTSPPELLDLYDQLSNRARKERAIDTGIGLIASSFAQPESRAGILSAMGGSQEYGDPMSLVTGIAEMQQQAAEREAAAAEKQRQLQSIPAIAQQYGIDEQSARMLFDNEQLDDYIMEQVKYRDADTSTVTTSDGTVHLIDNSTGQSIKQWNGTGSTEDEQLYNADMADRARRGMPNISMADWLKEQANLKTPNTVINNNMNTLSDAELLKGLDSNLLERFTSGGSSIDTISKIQEARRALDASGGVVMGDITSPVKLETMKLMSGLFGLPNEAANNTEVFQSSMKEIVLPLVKQLGTGNSISNADREFIEKAVGGDIRLTEGAARRILSIMERAQRNKIIQSNEAMERRVNQSAPNSPLRQAFMPHEVPELSQAAKQDLVDSIMADAPGHIVELKKNANNPDAIKEFDALYGVGAASIILSMGP